MIPPLFFFFEERVPYQGSVSLSGACFRNLGWAKVVLGWCGAVWDSVPRPSSQSRTSQGTRSQSTCMRRCVSKSVKFPHASWSASKLHSLGIPLTARLTRRASERAATFISTAPDVERRGSHARLRLASQEQEEGSKERSLPYQCHHHEAALSDALAEGRATDSPVEDKYSGPRSLVDEVLHTLSQDGVPAYARADDVPQMIKIRLLQRALQLGGDPDYKGMSTSRGASALAWALRCQEARGLREEESMAPPLLMNVLLTLLSCGVPYTRNVASGASSSCSRKS
jgi:hypothetical protein